MPTISRSLVLKCIFATDVMARNRNPRLPKIVVPIPFSVRVLVTNLIGKTCTIRALL